MSRKLVVLGGGASGLAAAITAGRLGDKVTVIERNERIGKKILVTGNGRCNFGNLAINNMCYKNDKFVSDVLLRSKEGANKLLYDIGLISYADSEGRLYPISETATSVLDCLRFECERLNINFILGQAAETIYKRNDCIATTLSNGEIITADRVIIAIGGKAQSTIYNLDKLVENRVLIPFHPALTCIKVNPTTKLLTGLRVKCDVSLRKDGKLVHTESGEVQFKENALSGIVVMNMSSIISRDFDNLKKYTISLDLMPTISEDDLSPLFKERYNNFGSQHLMTGIYHNKIADELKQRAIDYGKNDIDGLCHVIKHFDYDVLGLGSFEQAQVMTGGIDTKTLKTTLEFRKTEGLYACGEAIDVDGLCGGYNLHWAFSSGIVAGKSE